MRVLMIASCLLLFSAGVSAAESPFIWQEAQAKRLPGGMLEWAPKPYRFRSGSSQRYIDFDKGDDSADGSSTTSAWKHHPWDANATGRAKAAAREMHTFVFKGGVIYRGQLVAQASGSDGHPIRLCRDPNWGAGPAAIVGSDRISSGWQKVSAPPEGLPEPEKVWVVDVGKAPQISALWEMRGDAIERIPLARTPNWGLGDPDDVKAEWAEWDDTWPGYGKQQLYPDAPQVKKDRTWCASSKYLTDASPNAYDGMTVWTEYLGLMGNPYPSPVLAYDPAKQAVQITPVWTGKRRPVAGNRFFLENHPRLLDSPGEYWHDTKAGKLYLRLEGDRDPNKASIEIAQRGSLIQIADQSHIAIEGLTFRFQRVPQWYDRFWAIADEDPACVDISGDAAHIRITNNRFENVVQVLHAGFPQSANTSGLVFADNDVSHCDYGAIGISHGDLVQILRNRFYDIGSRPRRSFKGETVHISYADRQIIAGNIIEHCYGQGIDVRGGKGSAQPWGNEKGRGIDDLTRILIFDNQVLDGMLTGNDYGNIETWQGGPAYVFNNVSLRPHGYWKPFDQITNDNFQAFTQDFIKRYPNKEWPQVSQGMAVAGMYGGTKRGPSSAGFTFAYYNDGGFKQYLFNNIGQGRSSDVNSSLCTTAAWHGVGGSFMVNLFNNTFHRFAKGVKRHGRFSATDLFVGNTFEDMGSSFIDLGPETSDRKPLAPDADPERDALQNVSKTLLQAVDHNVFSGHPGSFGGNAGTGHHPDLEALRIATIREGAIAAGIGQQVKGKALRDAGTGDFRPAKPTYDNTQRIFVPWGLAATVGEWQFRRMKIEPGRVVGEHWFMDDAHTERGMYRYMPRHDLTASTVSVDDYIDSPSEGWIASALRLNGRDQFLSLSDASLKADVVWQNKKKQDITIPASVRQTPDMDVNDFLIEAIVAIDAGANGGLVGKVGTDGYQLVIDDQGRPVMELWLNRNRVLAATCPKAIADGAWHHLLVEVERNSGITFHLDGTTIDAAFTSEMPPATVSLANNGDLLIGKDKDGKHLAMAIDFLRICKDDLAGARTSIEELYAWEFAGPHLKTWWGKAIR